MSVVAGALWVLAGTVCALLPMRVQRWIGGPLILLFPVVLWLLGRDFGVLAVAFGLFAFVSMFRRPLWALWRHLSA